MKTARMRKRPGGYQNEENYRKDIVAVPYLEKDVRKEIAGNEEEPRESRISIENVQPRIHPVVEKTLVAMTIRNLMAQFYRRTKSNSGEAPLSRLPAKSKMQDGDDTRTMEVAQEIWVVENIHDYADGLWEELLELRISPFNSSTVFEISPVELASVLPAFVVRYEPQMGEQFEDIKHLRRLRRRYIDYDSR